MPRLALSKRQKEVKLFKVLDAEIQKKTNPANVIRDVAKLEYFHILVTLVYKLNQDELLRFSPFLSHTLAWNRLAHDEVFLHSLEVRSDFRCCCEAIKKREPRRIISFLDLALEQCHRVITSADAYIATMQPVLLEKTISPALLLMLAQFNQPLQSQTYQLGVKVISVLLDLQRERASLEKKILVALECYDRKTVAEKCKTDLQNILAIQSSMQKLQKCLQVIKEKIQAELRMEKSLKTIYLAMHYFFAGRFQSILGDHAVGGFTTIPSPSAAATAASVWPA